MQLLLPAMLESTEPSPEPSNFLPGRFIVEPVELIDTILQILRPNR